MASKQQEIDVLESWEDIEETDVLEKSFRNLLAPNKSLDNRSSLNGMSIILTGDDALRSQYVPPEPTVKILKRPTKDTNTNSDNKIFQPKKTLQQREQEYAQARLRILGEAHTSEKAEEKTISCIQMKMRPIESDNVVRLPRGPDGTSRFKIRR